MLQNSIIFEKNLKLNTMKTKLDLTGMTSKEVEILRNSENYKISTKALIKRGWMYVTIN
jgi:hypothetical protein